MIPEQDELVSDYINFLLSSLEIDKLVPHFQSKIEYLYSENVALMYIETVARLRLKGRQCR